MGRQRNPEGGMTGVTMRYCRDDANRFALDQLDERLGALNWTAVPMDEADDFPPVERS
jgi:hypothetical protein